MAAVARAVKSGQEKRAAAAEAKDPRVVFEKYDVDNGGSIDVDELSMAFRELRVQVTKDQLQLVVESHGTDGSLDYAAFEKLLRALKDQQVANEEMKNQARTQVYGDFTLPRQEQMIYLYNNPTVVFSVAAIILGNFLVNIIEKEMDPMGNLYTGTWAALDLVFNIVFLFELLLNMYGYAFRKRFFNSPWNCFDFFIVSVSVLLIIGGDNLPGELKKLKLLRAFRVFRLFKRIKSLNQIIVALIASIPGVLNALVIMIIFFCIYAILAVELFVPFGEDGTYPVYWQESCKTVGGAACALPPPGVNGTYTVSSMTARGYTNGYEYYGTFSRALFTLFQVMTGESWSEAIARPLIFGLYNNSITAAAYFVSFILLTQVVLINVVVAVLLDKFTAGDEPEPAMVDAQAVLDRMDDIEMPVTAESDTAKALGASRSLPPPPHKLKTPDEKMDRILEMLEKLDKRISAIEEQGKPSISA